MSDQLKRAAAEEAARRVESGQRIGLGTGSTAWLFLEMLGDRLDKGDLHDVTGVPTSRRTEELAVSLRIPLTTLEAEPRLDLGVDGADEVDPQLNLIKGLGGALLREKIVAASCTRFIVIVDEGKIVERLGERAPVPVEVLPFGWKATAKGIQALGGEPVLREGHGELYRTDQGNYVLDSRFKRIDDAAMLSRQLDSIPGVLGHGLFLNLATEVIVGTPSGGGTRVMSRKEP